MNNLSEEELNKLNKLKQKLYSRSLNNNASRLKPLHEHNLNISTDWEKTNISVSDNIGDNNNIVNKNTTDKESVADFLNNKFNPSEDELHQNRVEKTEKKIEQINLAAKVGQAKLNSQALGLYGNLSQKLPINNKNDNSFQENYKPDFNTVKIGLNADQQEIQDEDGGQIVHVREKKRSITFGFIMFMLIFLFFVGAGFYTYVNIIKGVNTISTNKIDIKVTGPVSVKSGEISDFIVEITNNNSTELILSDLIIQYPDGSKSPQDRSVDLNNERINIGTIKPGETIRQKNSVIFFGEQNVKKNIRYSYEFNIQDSSTVFATEKDIGVFISGSPINISINNVKEINNNQELNFDIEINSNSTDILKNIQLKIEYPFGYKYLESNIKPIYDNNTWSINNIEPLSSTTIRLKGKITGEVNVNKNFRFTLGIEDEKTKEMLTVLNTQDIQVAITKPFVITKLLLEGQNNEYKSVDYEDLIRSDLIITNNLNQAINDVIVEVAIDGVLIDKSKINAVNGFYDSGKDIIFWDKSLSSGLTSIPPGESRELSFNLSVINKDDSLIKTLKRAATNITISIKANRLGENRVTESVAISAKKQLRLKTETLYNFDLSLEDGVYPPEVNKETVFRYTGHITNTANTLNNVIFTAKLPPNATWKEVYGSNDNLGLVKYNQSTREITMTLANIEAGTGIDKNTRDFYFVYGFTPSLTQKGQYPTTISNPTITATDSFTEEKLSIKGKDVGIITTLGDLTSGSVK